MALKVGELYASFGIDQSGLNSAISGIEKKCQNIANSLSGFGKTASLALTTPITLAAKNIYKAGSEFEAQMSKVGAISGATGQDFDALTQKAIEMGSTTSFTATEAGEALEYMAMAGWKTDDMLAGLQPIMDLAAASGESLGTTSDIVTDALTAFGLTAADTGHFADVLAAASTNANTNVGLLGESFKYVAPMAGSLGYSIDDVAVALGIMANNGIKGSQAGTSLQRILQNMVSPTAKQAEAMEKLGLSLTDSKGNMKSLKEVMGDMRLAALNANVDLEAMQKAVGELDAKLESGAISEEEYVQLLAEATGGSTEFLQAVSDLAGARGLSGMLSIMNSTEADFDKLSEAIRNCDGAASEMAARMLDNVQGDMTLFKSAVEGLEVSLFNLSAGGMREVIQKATGIINAFHNADSATQVATMKMAGLAAAAGPVALGLGKVVGFLPKIVPLLKGMIGPFGIVTGTMALFAAVAIDANNDIGRTFTQAMTTVGKQAKVYKKNVVSTMRTISKRIPRLVKSINTGLNLALPDIIDAFSETLHGAMNVISDNASSVLSIGQTIITKLSEGLNRGLPNLIPAAVNMVSSIASGLISNIPVLIKAAGNIVSGIWNGLKNTDWGAVGRQILDAIGSAITTSASILSETFDGTKWSEIGQSIWNSIESGFTEVSNWAKMLILGDDYTPDSTWGDAGRAIWTAVKNAFSTVSDWAKQLILGADYTPDASWAAAGKKIWGKIKGAIGAASELVKELVLGNEYTPDASWSQVGTKIWNAIKSGIKSASELIKELVLGEGYTADSSWADVGSSIWNTIKSGIGSATDLIKELILGEDYTPDASWSQVGSKIWSKIKDGIGTAIELVKGLVLGDDYEADPSWSAVGRKIWSAIKSGIEVVGDWLVSLVSFTPDDTWKNYGRNIWNKIKNGITATGDWLKEKIGFSPDDSWSDIGTTIIGKIVEYKAEKYAKIGQMCTDLVTELVNWKGWSGLAAGFTQIATTVITQIAKQIPNLGSVAVSIIEKIGTLLSSENLEGIIGNLTNAATSIVNAIIDAIPEVANAAVNIIQAIGSLFTAEGAGTSIADGAFNIATAIVNAVIDGIPKITTAAVDIINAIGKLFTAGGDGAQFRDQAFAIAKSLINSIASAIPSLADAASSIVTAIGNALATYDWSGLITDLTGLGEAVINAIVESIKGIGEIEVSIIEAISNMLGTIDWDSVTVSLEGFANMLINGIKKGIEALTEADVGIITALGDMLANVDWSKISDVAGSLASTLIGGLVEGIKSLVNGSTQIMDALIEMIGKIDWSEVGDAVSNFAQTLFDGIVEGAKTLVPDMTELISAIGRGIEAAAGGLGELAGKLIGNIIKFILTPENWLKLIELGGEIINGIATGIVNLADSILKGAWNAVSGIFKGLFEALGLTMSDEAQEALNSAAEVINSEGDVIEASVANIYSRLTGLSNANGILDEESLMSFISAYNACLATGQEEIIAGIEQYSFLGNEAVIGLFKLLVDTSASEAERASAMIALNELGLGEYISNEFSIANQGVISEARNMSANAVDAFEAAFEKIGYVIPDAVKTGLENGTITVEEAAAQVVAAASTANDQAIAEANAAATGSGITDSLSTAEGQGETDVQNSSEGVVDVATLALETLPDVASLVGEDTSKGMADGIDNNASLVTTSMDTLSDETVKAALEKMTYETGYKTGYDYVNAIKAGIDAMKSTIISTMQAMAQAVVNVARSIITFGAGSIIGYSFSSGLAQGIRNGKSAVINAAIEVATAAVSAAKNSLAINSPSRIARDEIGLMYDKGLVLGLEKGMTEVNNTAANVSRSLHDSFFVGEPSRNTVYTARQNALETEQAIVRAAGSKALQGSRDDAGQRTVHVILELNGETIAETFVPIVNDTMMAQMNAYSRR